MIFGCTRPKMKELDEFLYGEEMEEKEFAGAGKSKAKEMGKVADEFVSTTTEGKLNDGEAVIEGTQTTPTEPGVGQLYVSGHWVNAAYFPVDGLFHAVVLDTDLAHSLDIA